MSPERFAIVFVCTGNQCRSAMAEAFVRAAAAGAPVDVSSAGTLGIDGAPSPRHTVAAMAELGVDLSAHRSRGVQGAGLERADLVVGFELAHAAAAVVEGGAAPERVFGLVELVELLDGVAEPAEREPVARARALVRAAHARRRMVRRVGGEEVADPIGRTAQVHRDTAARVGTLCDRLVGRLFDL
ncbi:MAG TPA: hypothetical protein VHJ34_08585 [Actinomycetota bacterium]|nr:hypothetical protein [Actinomycetota bacterium]